jgi:hypothetical protein
MGAENMDEFRGRYFGLPPRVEDDDAMEVD